MRSLRNVTRFLALLMATAMIVAVLLMVAMPFADALPGAMYTVAVPLFLIIVAFAVVCAWALSKDVSPMASSARDAPLLGDVRMDDQVSMTDRRRQWARRYPTGFRSCRLTVKRDRSETAVTVNSGVKELFGVPLWAESNGSGVMKSLVSLSLVVISRAAQCNLYAFNANDQGGTLRMMAA